EPSREKSRRSVIDRAAEPGLRGVPAVAATAPAHLEPEPAIFIGARNGVVHVRLEEGADPDDRGSTGADRVDDGVTDPVVRHEEPIVVVIDADAFGSGVDEVLRIAHRPRTGRALIGEAPRREIFVERP